MKQVKSPWHSKRLLLLTTLLLTVAGTALTSCHKRCRCVKYDAKVDYYTEEELDARGKKCADMVYLEGLAAQYYSLCEWE